MAKADVGRGKHVLESQHKCQPIQKIKLVRAKTTRAPQFNIQLKAACSWVLFRFSRSSLVGFFSLVVSEFAGWILMSYEYDPTGRLGWWRAPPVYDYEIEAALWAARCRDNWARDMAIPDPSQEQTPLSQLARTTVLQQWPKIPGTDPEQPADRVWRAFHPLIPTEKLVCSIFLGSIGWFPVTSSIRQLFLRAFDPLKWSRLSWPDSRFIRRPVWLGVKQRPPTVNAWTDLIPRPLPSKTLVRLSSLTLAAALYSAWSLFYW